MLYESTPWCSRFDHAIDDDLVNIFKPSCVAEHNGCGNCGKQRQKTTVDGNEIDGVTAADVFTYEHCLFDSCTACNPCRRGICRKITNAKFNRQQAQGG